MGAAQSAAGGIVGAVSGVVMALAALGAGYTWALWQDSPTASDLVGAAVLGTLEPMFPAVFGLFVGLFVLALGSVVYSVRALGG